MNNIRPIHDNVLMGYGEGRDVRILGNTQNLLYFNPKHDGVSDVMRLFEFESDGSIGGRYGIQYL